MLTLRHLTIFKTVSETSNFTKAANQLYITQSAVSHTIRELEEYMGTILFDRLPKQVQLTSAGKTLLEEITPIMASFMALEKRIKNIEMQAPIHIVSSITIASYWLPDILKKFKQQMNDIPVYVKVVCAAEAITTLQAGEADLAFIEGTQPSAPFVSIPFSNYPLKIVCAPDYPVLRKNMTIEEFCSEQLLLRESGSAVRDALDSKLYLLGHTVHPLWESVNSTAIIQAAKSGLGITVLPEILIEKELNKGTLIALHVDELSLENDLIALWHKDKYMTPALKKLLDFVSPNVIV